MQLNTRDRVFEGLSVCYDNQNVSESTRADKLKGYCSIGYQQVAVIFYYKRVSLSQISVVMENGKLFRTTLIRVGYPQTYISMESL